MADHTVQEAIEILEGLSERRLVAPSSHHFYDGWYTCPTRCCPIWHLARAWKLLPPTPPTTLEQDTIVQRVVQVMDLDPSIAWSLISWYDGSTTKRAGKLAVLNHLRSWQS